MRLLKNRTTYPIHGDNPRIYYQTGIVASTSYLYEEIDGIRFRYPIAFDSGGNKLHEGPWEIDSTYTNIEVTNISPSSVDSTSWDSFQLTITGSGFGTDANKVSVYIIPPLSDFIQQKFHGTISSISDTQIIASFNLLSKKGFDPIRGTALVYVDRLDIPIGADAVFLTLT